MTSDAAAGEAGSSIVLPRFPEGYVLHTERLILRPPALEDVDALWPYVTDPRVSRFIAWEPHPNKEVTKGMLRGLIEGQKQGASYHWVIALKDELIGLVSLIDVHRTHRCWTLNRAELAYWLGPAYWGCGYATEASRQLLRFAFHDLAFHKIIVYHVPENPPSGAVAQRLGFRYVGRELEAFLKQGTWHSLEHYEILEREFCNQT
jgi:RimJ/RimL family protein N-acetyltransferase